MKDYKKTKQQLISELESLRERNRELEFLVTALKRVQTRHQEIIDSVPGMIFEIDLEGNLLYFNRQVTDLLGQIDTGTDRFNVLQAIVPEERERARSNMLRVYSGGKTEISEYCLQKLDGSRLPVLVHFSPIVVDSRTVGIREMAIDISERKLLSEQLAYLDHHDSLTGLYNRRYFEQLAKGLDTSPIGLLVLDIDGLQWVNDHLGSEAGDALLAEAARIVKNCFNQGEISARIGGDEFAVLIPGCSREALEEAKRKLKEQINQHNAQHPESRLCISIGCSYADRPLDEIKTMFAEAFDSMYREKLYQSWSARSAIVTTLMKALKTRDFVTEDHVERMQQLTTRLARAIGMPEDRVTNLRLTAQFHDIGKLGIPDHILRKCGPLTPDERKEMQLHCEIGCSIARSSPDLAPVADFILGHHEWWNGEGYPQGLKGEEIPLECRILAIADAYDAMVSDRPYRSAMTHEEAIGELERHAGTQFDPYLVRKFIELSSSPENNLFQMKEEPSQGKRCLFRCRTGVEQKTQMRR